MSLSLETPKVIGVPAPDGIERPAANDRFYFRPLSNDRFEVHHPFHGTTILGDRSRFPDPAVDDALVVGFQTFPYLIDSMKLSRPREYETHERAGEYAQLSHAFSLACIGRLMAGGPLDILDGFFNDAPHAYNGHAAEDNYQGHGKETLSDLVRVPFLRRSGVIDRLIKAEVFEGDSLFLRGTRLVCLDFLAEEASKVRRSFLNNNHAARRLDSDRFQYNEEEDFHTRRKHRFYTDQALSFVARMTIPYDDEGEQLVLRDGKTAYDATLSYSRKNSEHWCEPVQDLLSDELNLVERYFFVCDHPVAKHYQEFYPRDYLYNSASLMFGLFETVAKDDPAMKYLLTNAKEIAAHQRSIMSEYEDPDDSYRCYMGPHPPEGITLTKVSKGGFSARVRVEEQQLVFTLPPGKIRTINPRVLRPNGAIDPVTVLYPQLEKLVAEQHRWIGVYRGTIEMPDKKTTQQVADAVELVNSRWDQVLQRPPMPDSVLREQIETANAHVFKAGAFILKAA